MKTLILAVLATSLFFSANSQAEWTSLIVDEERNTETYVDADRIRVSEGLVYYWSLTNHTEPRSDTIRSVKAYRKANCETYQKMLLSVTQYTGTMGEGSTVRGHYTPPPEWTSAMPNSKGEFLTLVVCMTVNDNPDDF